MFSFNMLVIVKKKIPCFSSALEGEGERGAVTTQMIKDKAAHNLEYVIFTTSESYNAGTRAYDLKYRVH